MTTHSDPIEHALTGMLPALRDLADALADEATRRAGEEGAPVACRAACGACCRQLVPLLPAEGEALRHLVASLPAERRSVVTERARAARRSAEAAGLGAELAKVGVLTLGARHRLAIAWFALGIPCPFLEEESCSIHPDRPIACREYLVSNDPVHCATPTTGGVVPVELRGSAMEAAKQAARSGGGADPRRITTLVDALLDEPVAAQPPHDTRRSR